MLGGIGVVSYRAARACRGLKLMAVPRVPSVLLFEGRLSLVHINHT